MEPGFYTLTVGEFKKAHLRLVMDDIQKEREISDNRYNTYVENMKESTKYLSSMMPLTFPLLPTLKRK
jgi:hypothetical protein